MVVPVVLRAAKDSARWQSRFFAALRMTRRHKDLETRIPTCVAVTSSPFLCVSLEAATDRCQGTLTPAFSQRERGFRHYLNSSSDPPLSSAFGFSSVFGFCSLFCCAELEPNRSSGDEFSVACAADGAGFGASAAGFTGFSSVAPNPGGAGTEFDRPEVAGFGISYRLCGAAELHFD